MLYQVDNLYTRYRDATLRRYRSRFRPYSPSSLSDPLASPLVHGLFRDAELAAGLLQRLGVLHESAEDRKITADAAAAAAAASPAVAPSVASPVANKPAAPKSATAAAAAAEKAAAKAAAVEAGEKVEAALASNQGWEAIEQVLNATFPPTLPRIPPRAGAGAGSGPGAGAGAGPGAGAGAGGAVEIDTAAVLHLLAAFPPSAEEYHPHNLREAAYLPAARGVPGAEQLVVESYRKPPWEVRSGGGGSGVKNGSEDD